MEAFRPALNRGLFAVLAALLVALTTASVADAGIAHRYSRSFGAAGAGKISSPGGVEARSTTDVFVADTNGPVRRYSQAGEALPSIDTSATLTGPSSIAYYRAANATEYLYVLGLDPSDPNGTTPVVARYPLAGGAPTTISLPSDVTSVTGIAVDTDGQLYVGDTTSAQVVRVYSFAGAPLGSIDGTEGGGDRFGQIGGIAIDSDDTVYVTEPNVKVQKYAQFDDTATPSTTQQGTLPAPLPRTLSVDRSTDDVYVTDSPDNVVYGVTRYDEDGNREERFAEGADAGNYSAFGFSSTGGNVFAGNRNVPGIDVFQQYTAPDVTTGAAPSAPGARSVTVTGTVNAQDIPDTQYQFEYGTDTNYASKTDPVPVTGSTSETVTGELAGLVPNTTYHYRLVTVTGANTSSSPDRSLGEDRVFTTAAAPPTVSGESASAITFQSATLNATVNASNTTPASAYFEYGTDPNNLTATQPIDIFDPTGDTPISTPIQGLQPDTEYTYRVVATNGVQPDTVGPNLTFTTAPAPPAATAAQATAVSGTTAQFSGTVDTQGLSGDVSFVVQARNSPYAAVSAVQSLPPANGPRGVTGSVSGLPAGGVFEVRVQIKTDTSTTLSEPATFSTASLAVPVVSPPLTVDPFPYGCAAPRLAQPAQTLKAGRSATLTGSDLGVTGTVAFGSREAEVTNYSASRVTVKVPSAASGRVPVTVTCGRVSNTVTARVSSAEPSNRFSTSSSVKGTKASVKVKVPGRGAVSVSGSQIGRKSASPKKAGTTTLRVALTKKGRAALAKAKSKRLRTKVAVRYRPSGGSTRTAYRTLTFRR